jgi:homoserine dehydrogenase
MFLARHVASGTAGKVPYVEFDPERSLIVRSLEDTRRKHYLRFTTADEPGVLAKITRILGDRGISIASLVQEGADVLPKGVPIVVVTHEAHEGSVRAAILEIDALDIVVEKTVHLRIEDVAR